MHIHAQAEAGLLLADGNAAVNGILVVGGGGIEPQMEEHGDVVGDSHDDEGEVW